MTSAAPWLSVVTVVKDDPAGFTTTRDSLVDQENSGFEWVIIDSSGDRSEIPNLLAGFQGPKVYQWVLPQGIFAAMNEGLNLARGTYCYFLNAGDQLHSTTALATVRRAVVSQPLWLVGQVSFIDPQGLSTVPPALDFEQAKRRFFIGRFPPHQGTFTRTSDLRALGGFNVTYRIGGDYEVALKLSRQEAPMLIRDVLADFPVGGASTQQWLKAQFEFHRARKCVLQPTGISGTTERLLSAVEIGKQALSRALHMCTCTRVFGRHTRSTRSAGEQITHSERRK